MKGYKNKNFYHYVVETYDDNNKFVERNYYLTSEDICKKYDCCKKSFFNYLKEPKKTNRKLKNLKIYRILEPVHILTPNPDLV